jgi:nucleoside-diphosphate-sugar epimerase
MHSEEQLDNELSRPEPALIEMMRRLTGDIVILGIAGKMGQTLGRMAVRAAAAAGTKQRIIGVSRFSDPKARQKLEAHGVETVSCDILDAGALDRLPDAAHVIYMVGRKFGTTGSEPMTWGVNTLAASHTAQRYASSRIVVFSTGCVYPLVDSAGAGCDESVAPGPVGEYAQACLGRERIFQYFCETQQTPMLLYRLNYAIDLRYGVLHDIAGWIRDGKPVPLNVPTFNCIWQRDANERALLCLEHCSTPAAILNITGPETVSVRDTAIKLGRRMGKPVTFTGDSSGRAYLSDATASIRLFGPPGFSVEDMITAQADWIQAGGSSLNKPTHFEVSNGAY